MLFYLLDTNPLKPEGWDLVNPNHGDVPKDDPLYWTENLDEICLEDLLKYDFVFISSHTVTDFTEDDNAKLQEFVAKGGCLWIDDCGGMVVSNFFINFEFVGYVEESAKSAADLSHPVFNSVYPLSNEEISVLGQPGYGGHIQNYDPSFQVLLKNGIDDTPDMLMKEHGSGLVFISADDYGCAINDFSEYDNPEDYKFIYNIMSITGQVFPPSECSEDDSGEMDIEGAVTMIGREVRIPVRIQNAPSDAYSFGFEFTYDAGVLQPVGFEPGELVGSFEAVEIGMIEPGRLIVGGYCDEAAIAQDSSGYLAWISFIVIGGQENSCYPFQLENLKDDIVHFSTTGGCLCIHECNGDLNDDGQVTPADALLAFRCYLRTDYCIGCSDADRNGEVTPADARCIFLKYMGKPSCLD
ncbi:MAG: DUF4159 domain-containing protein [bacterium]